MELEDDITGLPEKLKTNGWSRVDGYVHAIAHAPREAISGDFTDGLTKENFTNAHVISSHSLSWYKSTRGYPKQGFLDHNGFLYWV